MVLPICLTHKSVGAMVTTNSHSVPLIPRACVWTAVLRRTLQSADSLTLQVVSTWSASCREHILPVTGVAPHRALVSHNSCHSASQSAASTALGFEQTASAQHCFTKHRVAQPIITTCAYFILLRLLSRISSPVRPPSSTVLFAMPVTIDEQYVRTHFQLLGDGHGDDFFARVPPTVDWTVMGSHALSGHYHSLQHFQSSTFARLNPRMRSPLALKLTNVIVSGRQAAVELSADGVQRSGKPFPNKYCWVVQYDHDGHIVVVRAYLDGELVNETINENQGP